MPRFLLDENVPVAVAEWLRGFRPAWEVHHVIESGLAGRPDPAVFAWAQAQQAIVITFDEDFTDARFLLPGAHAGIIRLRVFPTTIEETCSALERLFSEVAEAEMTGALIIIDRSKIRIRKG